ncbi:MAG: secondary thiamine-phosphate synthase enzyme YjbQ [Candidatus Omnitrophota bacterium]
MTIIRIKTQTREEVVDITATLQDIVKKERWQSGILTIYSPHTTAALSVNENADPDVQKDVLYFLSKSIPPSADFKHTEGNSDAHIKGALVNFSQIFLVENGRIQLGTWQGIFFMEFDGPRSREIWIKFIAG